MPDKCGDAAPPASRHRGFVPNHLPTRIDRGHLRFVRRGWRMGKLRGWVQRPIERCQGLVVAPVRFVALALEPREIIFMNRPLECAHPVTKPSSGLLAEAYSFRGIRPAKNARRPA